jgi:molybdenum cofactor cytidylyltransferase
MKFGPVPVRDALGAVLAHSENLPDGRLRKGIVLAPEDLARMIAAGVAEVVVARLDPGDMDEDAAALAVASALAAGDGGLRLVVAGTGRVNLVAKTPGLARVNRDAINAANAIDPMITVATVPPLHRMDPGGMVATIKIIAYGVAGASVQAAVQAASGGLGLLAPIVPDVALIETDVGADLGDKGVRSMQTRLSRLGVAFAGHTLVAHDISALADALLRETAGVICILTGSATSDIRDTAPAAVRAAGGTVAHFGMPVDPGNLLFIGQLGSRKVIGLPGCARSPALNGADWVLERILCGVDVTSADIVAMGVGGLLKEIPTRPKPRGITAT